MTQFVIRDALMSDIPACMALDHTYTTDRVWQMALQEDADQYAISFKTERLPRRMDATHPADERRLTLCLPPEQCFLVAAEREGSHLLAYLTMRHEPIRRVACLQDIVVAPDFRGEGIGSRLLNIARRWAKEHTCQRLIAETRTKNYPMIQFCLAHGLRFCGYNDHYLPDQDIAVFFAETLT